MCWRGCKIFPIHLRLLGEEHARCGTAGADQQQQQEAGRRGQPQLSEDSRLLYAEAFGSIDMGSR